MAVVAGMLLGYAMGLLSTFWSTILLYVLARGDRLPDWDRAPVSSSLAAAAIGFTQVGWAIAGVFLGAIYQLFELQDLPGFAGSPSLPFTAAVLLLAWLPLPPLFLFFPRYWWFYLPLALVFAALFGWGIPVLAETR